MSPKCFNSWASVIASEEPIRLSFKTASCDLLSGQRKHMLKSMLLFIKFIWTKEAISMFIFKDQRESDFC